MTSLDPPLLELRGISKRFAGVQALDDVSFELYPGEVHMLLGENGAGKSTLMKVLCGAHKADAGEFFHKGQPVTISGAADAQRLGIAVIFQEFTLVPYLSVAQNIFLGREPKGRLPGAVDHVRMREQARVIMDQLGMALHPDTMVATLGVAQQQMVEIAKALSQDARILVLDEPTAALSDNETEKLFRMIDMLKQQGVAMVYISHRMAEVFSMGDRITVLRDGKKVGFRMPRETEPDELVSLMVGRKVDMSYAREYCKTPGELALRMQGVTARSGIHDINLEVRAGEIVGLAGLVGSGRTEVARAVFRRRSYRLRKHRDIRQAPERRAVARAPAGRGAHPRKPQDARARAHALGGRQPGAGKPAAIVSVRVVLARKGGAGGA
jgi:ribose transport system ATP-binding protein